MKRQLIRIYLISIVLCLGLGMFGWLIGAIRQPDLSEMMTGGTDAQWWFDLSSNIVTGTGDLMTTGYGLGIIGGIGGMIAVIVKETSGPRTTKEMS